MIWKLLRRNISVGQILGYAIANFIGLAIVLSALRFYSDVKGALSNADSKSQDKTAMAEDYLVVSKPVSVLNTLSGTSKGFSQKDIEEIKSQPWASDAGTFTPADFHVTGAVDLGGRGFETLMFLESVPDEFIDIKPRRWKFDEAKGTDQEVPIIISKDYLALYNFGFASSRNLPQLSENLISQIPIALKLSGNGHNDYMKGRIVGFSSRLNTIAVPDDFMKWANDRYSTSEPELPSRLIVKVNKPGDPAITKYMDKKGYEVGGDKLDSGKAAYFLTLLTGVVVSIGAIISLLALFILMLSIFLLLQKNRSKISDLLLLGYTPLQVSKGYFKLVGTVNAIVLVLAVATMFGASALWEKQLHTLSVEPSSPWTALCAGIAIIIIITAINFIAIYRSVRKAFR